MEDWQQRVVEERDQLQAKFDKLAPFLETDMFKQLDETGRSLMYQQYHHMQCYLQVLNTRIERFNK